MFLLITGTGSRTGIYSGHLQQFNEHLDFIFLWVSRIIKPSWEQNVPTCNSCAVVCVAQHPSGVFGQTVLPGFGFWCQGWLSTTTSSILCAVVTSLCIVYPLPQYPHVQVHCCMFTCCWLLEFRKMQMVLCRLENMCERAE